MVLEVMAGMAGRIAVFDLTRTSHKARERLSKKMELNGIDTHCGLARDADEIF
jgi:hypothetical protein